MAKKTMKALSIYPQYVAQIVMGDKKEEYRNWTTKHRGDLLICTTATDQYYGYAACVAEVTGIYRREDGVYAWCLANVRSVRPWRVKGKQRLWDCELPSEFKVYDSTDVLLFDTPEQELAWVKEVSKKKLPQKELDDLAAVLAEEYQERR
jgi:hypothetical protein